MERSLQTGIRKGGADRLRCCLRQSFPKYCAAFKVWLRQKPTHLKLRPELAIHVVAVWQG